MATTAVSLQIVPESPPSAPTLRAADQGVAEALESVLSENTRRVYGAQWRLFESWCAGVGLASLPAEPLTVARYLAARAGSGAAVASLRLATSAITKAHQWAKLESPGRGPGVRASLKGWGRRLAKPQRQAGALTSDVLKVHLVAADDRRAVTFAAFPWGSPRRAGRTHLAVQPGATTIGTGVAHGSRLRGRRHAATGYGLGLSTGGAVVE